MNEKRSQALKSIKTAKGQLEGIVKMIDEGRYCIDISNQLMACIALLQKANYEILSGHLQSCVKESMENGTSETKLNELDTVLKRLTK